MIDNTVSISCGGKSLTGWTSVRITRGIEIGPATFELSCTEKDPNLDAIVLTSGDPCVVKIGSDVLISGYIGAYVASFTPDSHTVTISGASKFADLLRCSATQHFPVSKGDPLVFGNCKIAAGTTFGQLAELLTYTAGLSVIGDSDQPLPQIIINLGESSFQVLESTAQFARKLIYDNPSGNFVIADVGTESHSSGFKQGVNIYAATATFNQDDRYSDYYVYDASFNSQAEIDPNALALKQGYASDSGVKRFKPMIFISDQVNDGKGNTNFGQQRADWEMKRRYGRSQAVTVVADSWRDSSGKLWQPNMLAPISLPLIHIDNVSWLIASVTYSFSVGIESGTSCTLTLMPPEAFAVQPVNIQPFNWDINAGLNNGVHPNKAQNS